MSELLKASAAGTLREVFCVGTAAVVIPASRIGWQRRSAGSDDMMAAAATDNISDGSDDDDDVQEILLPTVSDGGGRSIAQALWERLVDIQEGRVEWEGWSVPCEK
jgi:branched-chain amino acid aminotransferase